MLAAINELSTVQSLCLCRGVVCHMYECIKNPLEAQSMDLAPDALDNLILQFTDPASTLGNHNLVCGMCFSLAGGKSCSLPEASRCSVRVT